MFQTIWNVLAKNIVRLSLHGLIPLVTSNEHWTARNEEGSRCRFSFILPYRATRGFNNDLQNYY